VQVHDRQVESAAAGQRVAVALVGVERSQAGRGDTLAAAGTLVTTYRLECSLTVVDDAPRGLRTGERVTVHHGTAEAPARVAVRGGEIVPGAEGTAQLRLERPVAALAGDHVVVRLTAPRTTVAGGRVLDPSPTRSGRPHAAPKPEAAPARARVLSSAGADELERRLGAEPFAPPPLTPADREPAAYLAQIGRIVRAGKDLAFTTAAFEQARDAAVELAGEHGSVTIAQLRDRLDCSRRYAQALLEALDAAGITRRVGDERVLRRRGREMGA
jgi:selenocysteine-specific elongation factor